MALAVPKADYLAAEIHEAIAGLGTNEEVLIEILCTRTNQEMRNIIEAYERRSVLIYLQFKCYRTHWFWCCSVQAQHRCRHKRRHIW